MSALSINPPFPVFPDLDGQPLEDGYIWIGVAGLNPLTNPIVVYWDAALTIPAPQPIRTIGGFPARAGSPARLYANSDYSIQVQNKNGSVTYSSANATELLSSALVTFIQAGAGAVQRTAQSKMREMVSVFDFMTAAQISDVSSGTGAIDVSAAIISAIASFPNLNGFPNIYDNASTLFFPPGKYYCGQTIFINKTIRLLGAAGADIGNNFSATTLEFAANVHGFIVNQWNSAGATGSGNGTIFENLSIIQKQTAGRTVGRGIWSKARCTIKFCTFFYWAEAGIYFDASAGSGGQSEGNANCFSIEYSVSSVNLGHGIYLNGADVNAGRIIGVDCSNNGGWGIWG